MPDNYSITTFNFIEEILDSIYAGNMISGGTMTITPDSGYVVSAANFSHGTLPEAIATCVFTDTGTAGQPGNTVLVTFTFGPLFQITSSLPPIYIHINGDAHIFREDDRTVDFSIDFIDNTVKNLNGYVLVNPGGGITENPSFELPSSTDSNGIQSTNLSGTIPSGEQYIIATIFTNTDSSYHFNDPPTIRTENIPEGIVSLSFAGVITRNSDNDVTGWSHRLMFGSNSNLSSLSGGKVFIEYKGIADRSSTKEILKVVYGDPEVSASGATRTVKVVGDVGAEFDITVTKNSNNTSIMNVGITNADIIHIPGGLIRGINKTLTASETGQLIAEHEFIQVYPASGSNEIYHINVTPKNGTILNSNLPQAAPQGIIYQYTNPTITLDTDAGTNYGVTTKTTIAYTGRPNSTLNRLKHIKKIKEKFSFTYVYTKTGSHTFTRSDLPVWSMTDASSDWDQSVTDHGNIIRIFNIAIALSAGDTVATVTGDVIIKKFGTASVTFNLDSSEFLTSA